MTVHLTEVCDREWTPLWSARQEAGLSREALAARAGVSAATIYRLEAGRVQPQRLTARALAATLGWAKQRLFPPLHDEDPAATGSHVNASTAEQGRHAPD